MSLADRRKRIEERSSGSGRRESIDSFVSYRNSRLDEEDREERISRGDLTQEERKGGGVSSPLSDENKSAAAKAVDRYASIFGNENPLDRVTYDPLKSSAKYLYTDAAVKKSAPTIDALAGKGTASSMRASLAAQQMRGKKENLLENYLPARSTLENTKTALSSVYKANKNAETIDKLYGEGSSEKLKSLAWGKAIAENQERRNQIDRAKITEEYGSVENYRNALKSAYDQTPEAAQKRRDDYEKYKARIAEIDSILEERGDTGTGFKISSGGEISFSKGHDNALAREREVLQKRINEYDVKYKTTDDALLGTVDHPDVNYESYIDPGDPLEKYLSANTTTKEETTAPKYYSDGADELIAERNRISALAGETPMETNDSRKAQELGRPWADRKSVKKIEASFVEKLREVADVDRIDATVKGLSNSWDQLSENEINYYRGLKQNDPKAAEKWLKDMTPVLNTRAYLEEKERYESGMETLPWYVRIPTEVATNIGTTAVKPFADILAGMSWVKSLAGEYNPFSGMDAPQLTVDMVRSESANALNKLFGTENAAGEVYQMLMAGVDSAYGYKLFNEEYVKLMGIGAGAEKTRELYEEGQSGWRIFAEGVAAGLAEYLTEKVSLDVFLGNYMQGAPSSAKDFWKRFTVSGLVEGAEEVAGNNINRTVNNLLWGADSEEQKRIDKYVRQGNSQEDAILMAFTDDVVEDLKSLAGGFITMVPMAGGAYVGAYKGAEARGRELKSASNVDDAYDFAIDLANEMQNKRAARNLEKAAEAAKANPTDRNVGYLANAIDEAIESIESPDQQTILAVKYASALERKQYSLDNATVAQTGQSVEISQENPIAKIDGDKIWLNTSDGVMQSTELDFNDDIARAVVNSMSDMDVTEANAILRNYTGGDVAAYINGMKQGVLNGKYGVKTGEDFAQLTRADQKLAVNLGKMLSETETNPAVVNDAPGLDVESVKKANAKYTSKETRRIDAIGRMLKTRVEVVDEIVTEDGGQADAEYDRNTATIRLSAKAKDPVGAILAHEVVHRVRSVSEDAYQALVEFVRKNMSAEQKAKAIAFRREQYGADKSLDFITEETVGDAFADILRANPNALQDLVKDDRKLGQKILDTIRDIIVEIDRWIKQYRDEKAVLSGMTAEQRAEYKKAQKEIAEEFAELRGRLVAAENRFVTAIKAAEAALETQETVAAAGMGIDTETDTLYSLRYEPGMNGVRSRAEIVQMMVEQGEKKTSAERFMKDINGVANQILGFPQYLDFAPDARYRAIKQNSDYPQGTIDLTNNCPKREGTTVMFDMLQRMFPERMFTAEDIVEIKKVLEEEGIETACDACFVEDRRQKLGEIAGTFIDMWKTATETGKPLQKTNAKGDKVTMRVTKTIAGQYGVTKGALYDTTDKYIPNQYDLVTYEGFAKLQKDHPWVAAAFEAYNNSRGQQAGRFIEGHAEYKREILNWNQKKVDSVNAAGGLRIFSFSDFQPVHMLDIIQVIADCAAKGVKIQGYTKNPLFAQLVRNTGVKLNRSLIPFGATGMRVENGRKVLAYDTKGGIDINSADFLDERDNPNVGNILIGINPEQIGIAFLDDFVDYIIPFHSNKAKAILQALGIGEWNNYKMSQTEKNLDGSTAKKQVNIYTDVIGKYGPRNKTEFVDAFLEECRKQNKIPRFAEFLNKEYTDDGKYSDEGGKFNYTYREGYHKLLIDFKMFDRQGNILLQQTVRPDFDPDLMKRILDEEIKRRQEYVFPQKVFDRVKAKFEDNGKRYKLTKPISRSETQKNITEVALMDSVKDLSGEEFKKSDIDLITQVSTYFDNLNNKVNTSYGPIKLEEKGIKSVIGHRLRRNKAIAFAAIPEVLQNGKIIDYQTNWKGRGYNTAVFAAPIKINGVDYYMGCVVNIYPDHNAYYLHDVLLKQNEGTLSFKTGTETGTPSDNVPSIISLLQEINNVNPSDENSPKYSLTVTPEQSMKYLELAKDPEKNEAELSRMVEEAAVEWGALTDESGNPLQLYHGTRDFGFTVFGNPQKVGYFFTNRLEVASTYSGKESVNQVSKKVRKNKYGERRGNYAAYIKSQNLLTVDCKFRNWDDIAIDGREVDRTDGKFYGLKVTNDTRYGFNDFTTTDNIVAFAKENGYDGVLFKNLRDNSNQNPRYRSVIEGGKGEKLGTSNVYAVFEPSQIKSADPVTYDDNGNVIPLEERFNPEENDIRRSLPKEGYAEFLKKYGSIPQGETPFRDLEVPQRTGKRQNVSQTVRTVLEAEATPDTLVPTIEDLVADGDFSYEVYTDEEALGEASKDIKKKGFVPALTDWAKKVARGQVSKTLTAEGWALYNAAATSGDAEAALTVLRNMVAHQRSAAQALQASRILKKMSPEAQLYNVEKTVENLIEDVKERYGKAPDISVDPNLAEDFLNARSDEERAATLEKIYKQIALQLPSRFIDRWNAWRYLAMLGNPRTHIRNIVGNAGFAPVVAVKDLTATAIESAVDFVSRGKLDRTKGLLVGKQGRDLLAAAWADYDVGDNRETALGERKYSDAELPMREIEEYRRIFGNTRVKAWNKTGGAALEGIRKFNTKALDVEDVWFSRPHYALALAQYCKAKGISAEQLRSGKGLDAARAYAAREAQKATYRDTNAFSQLVSRLGRTNFGKGNGFTKGAKMLVEGILPFRKTPANILARGVEYSPIGLLKSITWDLGQVIAKNMSGAEMIDHLSAGLTGTGLLALGLWLASMGLVRGHGGDDDKKKEFEKLLGYQNYALQLPGGTSVTLDWLAPEALPFFVGVNLYEEMSAGGKDTLSDAFNAIGNVSEPFLEMSCLQSLNDLLDSIGYAKSKGFAALPSILVSSATSYLTQGLPTVLGQAERTAEDKRMTTYTDQKGFVKDLQYTLGKASAKVPGFDYNQIPYIDAWGREEETGNFGTRLVNNFVNPSYVKKISADDTEKELVRLYDQTGDGGVFPKRASNSFTANGEKYELNADQYVRYAQTKGGTAYEVVGMLVGRDLYKSLPDTDKTKVIEEAYTYAEQVARTTAGAPITESWVSKAVEANRRGITPDVYIIAWEAEKNVGSVKDANGKTVDNSHSLLAMKAIYEIPGLTAAQRRYLFDSFGVGKKVVGYSQKQVEDELKRIGG